MNRTNRLKLGYVVVIACLGAAIVGFLRVGRPGVGGVVLLALLLLVPGRVQGFFWREFFRGRALLAANDPRGAIPHLERFLVEASAHG
jgi:hypothetical protein